MRKYFQTAIMNVVVCFDLIMGWHGIVCISLQSWCKGREGESRVQLNRSMSVDLMSFSQAQSEYQGNALNLSILRKFPLRKTASIASEQTFAFRALLPSKANGNM